MNKLLSLGLVISLNILEMGAADGLDYTFIPTCLEHLNKVPGINLPSNTKDFYTRLDEYKTALTKNWNNAYYLPASKTKREESQGLIDFANQTAGLQSTVFNNRSIALKPSISKYPGVVFPAWKQIEKTYSDLIKAWATPSTSQETILETYNLIPDTWNRVLKTQGYEVLSWPAYDECMRNVSFLGI